MTQTEHSSVPGSSDPYELSATQAAQVLKPVIDVSAKTIRRWAEQGALHSIVGPGNRRLFRRSDLDRFVDKLVGTSA